MTAKRKPKPKISNLPKSQENEATEQAFSESTEQPSSGQDVPQPVTDPGQSPLIGLPEPAKPPEHPDIESDEPDAMAPPSPAFAEPSPAAMEVAVVVVGMSAQACTALTPEKPLSPPEAKMLTVSAARVADLYIHGDLSPWTGLGIVALCIFGTRSVSATVRYFEQKREEKERARHDPNPRARMEARETARKPVELYPEEPAAAPE